MLMLWKKKMMHARYPRLAARLAGGCVLAWLAGMAAPTGAAAGQATGAAAADYELVVRRYCVACHNARLRTADLALDEMDLAHPGDAVDTWEKVAQKLRGRAMPPPGRPRPDEATYDQFATWLETSLDRAAEARPNPDARCCTG